MVIGRWTRRTRRDWRVVALILVAIGMVAASVSAQVRTGGKGGGLPGGGPGSGAGPGQTTGGRSVPELATIHHVLDRVTYGATEEHVALARQIGLEAFIRLQLNPNLIPENPTLSGLLATLPPPYTAVGDPAWTWEDFYNDFMWRARYADRQLQEIMTDFWSNHFSTTLSSYLGLRIGWYSSLHFNELNQPAIAFTGPTSGIKLMEWDGSRWNRQNVAPLTFRSAHTSLDYDSSVSPGSPVVSYWNSRDRDLRLSRRSAGTWQPEVIDSGIDVGATSLKVAANGDLFIGYVKYDQVGSDAVNGELRVAKWNGAWVIDVVDGPGPVGVGWYTSLALDANGQPSVSYFDADAETLKYAEWNDATQTWDGSTIDATPGVGSWTSLARTRRDEPAIAYYDSATQRLLYIERDRGVWQTPQVVDTGGVGEHASLAFDPQSGDPVISYFDRVNYDLKLARGNVAQSRWDIEPVASTPSIEGQWNSLAFDPAGNAVISYYNGSAFRLDYARSSAPGTWSTERVDGYSRPAWINPGWERFETDGFRANAFGKFHDLLRVSATSPAMMYYLNNYENTAVTINENYGRELLELHTVGVDGGYTQDDVLEASKVMTGWGIEQGFPCSVAMGDFCYSHQQHFPGARTVMGRTFPDDSATGGEMEQGDALLRFLSAHPSTAQFVCKKLVQKFVADDPPAGLVGRCQVTWARSDGDIRRVLETILLSRSFLGRDYQLNMVRTPFEFSVAAARQVEAVTDGYWLWINISRQDMPLFHFGLPTGWPENGSEWSSTASLLKRWQYVDQFTHYPPGLSHDLQALVTSRGIYSADGVIEFFVQRLLRGIAEPTVLAELRDCLTGGDPNWRADDFSARGEMEDMLGLLMGLPVYNQQ